MELREEAERLTPILERELSREIGYIVILTSTAPNTEAAPLCVVSNGDMELVPSFLQSVVVPLLQQRQAERLVGRTVN